MLFSASGWRSDCCSGGRKLKIRERVKMPAVARKYKEFDLRFEPNRWGNKLYEKYGGDNIIAYDESGKEIGRLFYMQNTPKSDLGISIGVNPEHQRKGIATAMVRMAQDITGRGIAAQDANVEGRPFLESLERVEYTPKPLAAEKAKAMRGKARVPMGSEVIWYGGLPVRYSTAAVHLEEMAKGTGKKNWMAIRDAGLIGLENYNKRNPMPAEADPLTLKEFKMVADLPPKGEIPKEIYKKLISAYPGEVRERLEKVSRVAKPVREKAEAKYKELMKSRLEAHDREIKAVNDDFMAGKMSSKEMDEKHKAIHKKTDAVAATMRKRVWGEYPETLPSRAELEKIQRMRTPRSQASDLARQHSVVISADSPKVATWLKDQGTADIRGIDTPSISKRGSKLSSKPLRITPKTPRLR